MSSLVIQILGEGDLRWFLEGQEATASTSSAKSLAEKSWLHFKGDVIVFVPSLDLYLTQAKLPRLSSIKLRKAVPYAIEDEITEDVKNCHFAISQSDNAGFTPIAVVNRERMNSWLQLIPVALKSKIKLMIPEVLSLPWNANTWTIAEVGDIAWVKSNLNAGFSIEKNNLIDFLIQYQHENGQVEKITLYTDSESGLEKELVDHLKISVDNKRQDESWVVFLNRNYNAKTVINLLQGDYQTSYSSHGVSRLQKIFVSMAVGWLVLFSAFGFIKYAILNFQAHQLNNQLAAVYHDIYPGESATQNSKQRIESALAAVKKAKQQGVFLRLVALASPVLTKTPGITIQGATFNNAQFEVKIEASDFQLLDKVAANLRQKGIIAEQTHVAKSGKVIQSTLVMKER